MEKACIDINELVNVYSHASGAVYQSDKLNCFYVDFGGKFAKYNCLSLQKMKKVVEQVDIASLFIDTTRADFEIVTYNGCEHIYLLNALEIVAFKDLMQGAFTMFKLNNMISDCLHRLVV